MQTVDEYDRELLRLLQQNNRMTAEQLGEKVSLSPSAVQRRLKKLRDDRIIEADVSIISPSVAGIGLTCIVDVILQVGNSRAIDEFRSAMRAHPEVTQCYYVTGTYDFVLVISTRDMVHYEEFSKNILMDNANVKHFYTHVVMDKVKVGYTVPL